MRNSAEGPGECATRDPGGEVCEQCAGDAMAEGANRARVRGRGGGRIKGGAVSSSAREKRSRAVVAAEATGAMPVAVHCVAAGSRWVKEERRESRPGSPIGARCMESMPESRSKIGSSDLRSRKKVHGAHRSMPWSPAGPARSAGSALPSSMLGAKGACRRSRVRP